MDTKLNAVIEGIICILNTKQEKTINFAGIEIKTEDNQKYIEATKKLLEEAKNVA